MIFLSTPTFLLTHRTQLTRFVMSVDRAVRAACINTSIVAHGEMYTYTHTYTVYAICKHSKNWLKANKMQGQI